MTKRSEENAATKIWAQEIVDKYGQKEIKVKVVLDNIDPFFNPGTSKRRADPSHDMPYGNDPSASYRAS